MSNFYLVIYICIVFSLQVATRIMKFLIDNFGVSNLLGRENYEYYARITGLINQGFGRELPFGSQRQRRIGPSR